MCRMRTLQTVDAMAVVSDMSASCPLGKHAAAVSILILRMVTTYYKQYCLLYEIKSQVYWLATPSSDFLEQARQPTLLPAHGCLPHDLCLILGR